jgi:hypothetical protein
VSERKKGSTSVSLLFRLTDSTTGAAKSGIDVTTLKLQYERPGEVASTATSLTLLAALTTAWTSYAAKEVDATNSKGVYRVDCPDAAFATGADEVSLSVSGTGVETSTRLIDLTAFDSRDSVRGGLTALPNAAANATGGLATAVMRGGTAQAGAGTTITLDASASATNDLYKGMVVIIVSGTGAGQARTIISYGGANKVATVDRNWGTNPNNTSVFVLLAADNPALTAALAVTAAVSKVVVFSGTAQTGSTSNTIKLAAAASATSNIYNGDLVTVTGGTGVGQTRTIISYNGTTKVATVDKAWNTMPDNTSTFDIYASTTPSVFSDQGVLQAATSGTATLAATASGVSSVYVGSLLTILSGTDAGDTAEITAYNGTTKVATISGTFAVTPDTTSAYAVIPTDSGSGNPGGTQDVNVVSWSGTAVSVNVAGVPKVDVVDIAGQAVTCAAPVTILASVGTAVTSTAQTGDSYAIVNSGTFGNAALKGYVDDIGVAGAGLTALGDTRLANLDATISSRTKPADTQAAVTNLTNLPTAPTDWLTALAVKADAVTKIQAGLATPTNITAASGVALAANQHVIVDSGTVTTLTNLPAITAGWLTAAGIAASALNGKGDWLLASSYTTPPSAAAVSTQVASDLATAHGAGSWQTLSATVDANVVSVNGTVFSGPTIPSDRIMFSGTLGDQSAATPFSVILPSVPAVFNLLLAARVRITSGTGQYQERTVVSSNVFTSGVGVDWPWTTQPASGDTFQVLYDNSHQLVDGSDVAATVFLFAPESLAQLFTVDTTKTYADAVDGSVVKETAVNSSGGLTQTGVRAAIGLAAANLDTQLASVAVPGSPMTLADGAITEAKIAMPAETTGRPTGLLAMIRRAFEWVANKRTRDRSTGTVLLRNAADNGTLETQTQSTSGTVDTQTKGV